MGANKKITIRIWLYPFVEKGDIYKVNDMTEGGSVAILSKHHLDILIDDSIENIDTFKYKRLLCKDNFKDNKIIVFQHQSTEKQKHTNSINDCISNNKSRFFIPNIIPISNGSPKNNDNYRALKDAIELYNKVKGNKDSDSSGTKKQTKGCIDDDIQKYNSDVNSFKEICQSIPEQQTDWEDYFEKIEKIGLPQNAVYWVFVKNGINYQLIKLKDEFDLFKQHICSTSKQSLSSSLQEFSLTDENCKTITECEVCMDFPKKAKSKGGFNIILAPYDLTQTDYYNYLLESIIDRDVFGIKKQENRPLLVLCNKTGKDEILFNSSIWFWALGVDDKKTEDKKESEEEKRKISEYNRTKLQAIIGRIKATTDAQDYKNVNARENLDYNLRLVKENKLNRFEKGHTFIIPKLYPNELAFADQILSINTTTSINYEEIEKFHEATFRILLIDDKGISKKQEEQNDKKQEEQNKKKQEKPKAEIIEELMSAKVLEPFVDNEPKEDYINNRLIWNTKKIEHYYFTIDEERKKAIEKKAIENKGNGKFFDIDRHISSSCNQIVQVTNLTDAIVLLADHRIRFDLIMMDYLLDKKDKDENDRELATNFFLWFQDKRCENTDVDYLREKLMKLKVMGCEALKDIICSQELNCLANEYVKADDTGKTGVLAKIEILSMSEKQSFNRELRELVKGNRGPLKKFWFFPITAFNSTFIDDLVHNHVRLIDYYWHISKGADPITTPYTFLSLLNKFFYLQLENSIFLQSEITRFLRSTIKRLQEINSYNDFVAVMGNDYVSFVQKFMSRPNFWRDQATSLFSDYVWKEFYSNKNYKTLHILVNYIHKFYHRCAFGTKDDYTKIVIFLRDMKMYIDEYFPDWNRRGDQHVDMARLSDIVDICFRK